MSPIFHVPLPTPLWPRQHVERKLTWMNTYEPKSNFTKNCCPILNLINFRTQRRNINEYLFPSEIGAYCLLGNGFFAALFERESRDRWARFLLANERILKCPTWATEKRERVSALEALAQKLSSLRVGRQASRWFALPKDFDVNFNHHTLGYFQDWALQR